MAKPRGLTDEEVAAQEAPAKGLTDDEVEAQVMPEPTAPAQSVSAGESALQGYGQGASFGMSDELGGVVHQGVKSIGSGVLSLMKTSGGRAVLRRVLPGFQRVPDAVVDASLDQAGDEAAEQVLGVRPRSSGGPGIEGAGYTSGRDQMRGDIHRAQEANPKTFFASNIAGAMSVPMPGGGGAAKPFQTVIGRSLENAGKFGASGALAGFGNSDADLLKGEFGEIAKDTALGAGIGGGMGMLTGPAAYGWARHARPALQSLANSRAVAAIAPSAGILNRLRKKASVRGDEDIQKLGSNILDLEVLKPFSTAGATKARNDALIDFEGEAIGATMDKADDLVSQGVARPPSRDLQRQLTSKALSDAADTPASRALRPGVEAKLLQSVGDDVPRPDNVPATFREMWKNKSQLQSVLKPDEFSSQGQKLYNKGVAGYTKGVYSQVEGAVGPDDLAKLRESTKRYGTAKTIDDFLTEQTTRNAVNQPVSLGDMGRGAVMSSVTPGGTPVATLISSLMRGRTDSTIATGALALSKVRMGNPGAGMKATSEAVRQALSDDEEDAVQAFLKSP